MTGEEKKAGRVLVVDDERNIADVLSIALRFNGYEVEAVGDGQSALKAVSEFRPDLVLLDVMLPDIDGFEVARRLRERADGTPILFLTARDTTEDKVRGLTLGGDDYVTKPFSIEELLARVASVLRRFGNAGGGESVLRFGDLELDDDTREVFRAGATIELTDTEYRLLRYLLSHPRRVLTRAQILDHVWDYDFGGDARVLETYVSYLRKKLEAHGPRLIHTVRGWDMRSGFHLPELSLRVRLLVLLVVLATVGLAVADVISYRALHNYLYDRVDQQLESSVVPVSAQLAHKAGLDKSPLVPGTGNGSEAGTGTEAGNGAESGAGTQSGAGTEAGTGTRVEPDFGGLGGPGSAPAGDELPLSVFGQLRNADGKVLRHTNLGFGGEELPLPALPSDLEATARGRDIAPVTVGQRGGGSEQFRLADVRMADGTSTVVAVPLGDTAATLNHLAVIELIVSAAILLALALGGWWLVGIGLRPLRRMGEVAGDIAAGDLSRRVEPANDRTEIGRLGMSLNAMLEQIEAAFAEREASEARLRQFLADASHELRTPLASIRGYSELYRIGAGREPDQVERAMGRIESESERMAGLVDDLLALARIDEMRELARERIDLRALLEDVRDDARASSPDREITLMATEPAGGGADGGAVEAADAAPATDRPADAGSDPGAPIWIDADEDQLRRVFANLLRNAAVHTATGTAVEIALAADASAVSGGDGRAADPVGGTGLATVRIRDHGPGLPAGDPRAVFERFWRGGSASRGREDGGAGLGLAIVAAVVSAHGGEVDAANAPDGGAVFTVRLPLAA